MIDLTGRDGATILVAEASIFRLRAATRSERQGAVRVDYGGGYLLTLEPVAVLLARLAGTITLIELTTRSGTPVWLNVAAVTSVRDAIPANGPGSEIIVGGQYQHVIETVAAIEAKLNG